ncbi:allophanate hydrolase [Candidatus Macondimonas diazotrophica]|jgi:allophanate hydrolase|nr:allophanate hydrolase [Candidatus Macondimonas diazotrophica]
MDLVRRTPPSEDHDDEPLPDLSALQRSLANGTTAQAVAGQLIARRRAVTADGIWITEVPDAVLRDRAAALDALPPAARGALHGVPFAVKDNLDVAGLPTTAACPDFAYVPAHTAPAVQRLLEAGAMLVGKTNMDQFATGLSGTRTPFGAPVNAFDARYICGGSSSGSALALAHGLVSFSLGTDTAGSGRVPAALGNLVGLKPSRGRVSSRGVLPACRSLDCVSVFALTCADAATVLDVIAGFDAEDPFARADWPGVLASRAVFRFGVPQSDQLDFDGDAAGAEAFARTVAAFEALGGTAVPVDYTPFRKAARLLYEGPWLTERRLAIGDFLDRRPDAVLPVVRDIILGADRFMAADAFAADYQLRALRRMVEPLWGDIDCLLTPTIPAVYARAAVLADPVALNTRLGHYTNHMNLLDLCAVAVPAGFLPSGLPFGVTVQAPAGHDGVLLALADRLHRALNSTTGATGLALADMPAYAADNQSATLELAVCGGHMQGLALNHELTERGARFLERTRTVPGYRLYALAGFDPPRPGMVRDATGAAIELEVWCLPLAEVGAFLAGVPAPLAIGTIALEGGRAVKGFLCEPASIAGATDITIHGGWRAWLAGR